MEIDIEDVLRVQKAIKEHDGEMTKEELYAEIRGNCDTFSGYPKAEDQEY